MQTLTQKVTERLQDEICRVCLYGTAGGGCGLREDLACPILTRVDQIIRVVREVDSEKMDPYIDRLREIVCSDCQQQDDAGVCKMRDHTDCALDDYFTLIVEIVESEVEDWDQQHKPDA